MDKKINKVCIIGSGPAGLTAAIYLSRAMLQPLIISGYSKGGQLMTTTDVENFPGYPQGISGPKMIEDLELQAKKFGTITLFDQVNSIDISSSPFKIICNDSTILSHAIIIATGAEARWLNAEGESKLKSNGISTCATCDGAFFKGEELLVIGGGDSAMEEALFLTRYATKVTIIHRSEHFKASKIMLERARENSKIKWKLNSKVTKWITDTKGNLSGANLIIDNDKSEHISCGGAFIAIGHKPATKFLGNILDLDQDGYIVNKNNMMTSVKGIFSCGDVCSSSRRYKQAITASGEGCRAAMDCEKYLEEIL